MTVESAVCGCGGCAQHRPAEQHRRGEAQDAGQHERRPRVEGGGQQAADRERDELHPLGHAAEQGRHPSAHLGTGTREHERAQ